MKKIGIFGILIVVFMVSGHLASKADVPNARELSAQELNELSGGVCPNCHTFVLVSGSEYNCALFTRDLWADCDSDGSYDCPNLVWDSDRIAFRIYTAGTWWGIGTPVTKCTYTYPNHTCTGGTFSQNCYGRYICY